jgi:FixJ family two-component response regulator
VPFLSQLGEVQWRHFAEYRSNPERPDLPPNPLISIVDDDEGVREATQAFVRSLGYRAVAFASAEEFLGSDHVHATACLITDVEMPGLNGVELQERLIDEGYQVPIIFITAYPNDNIRARAERAGAVGFFSKPFLEDHLITCLNKALNGRNSDLNT